MLQVTQLAGFGRGRFAGGAAYYVGQPFVGDYADRTTFTLACSFGEPAPSRVVAAAIVAGRPVLEARGLASATIGGVAASLAAQETGQYLCTFIIAAPLPGGSAGDIVLTFSGNMEYGAGVKPVALYNTGPSAFDAASDSGLIAFTSSGVLSVPTGGLGLACAVHHSTVGGLSWSGVDDQLSQGNATIAGSPRRLGWAARGFPAGAADLPVSVTSASTGGIHAACWASFPPA